MAYSDDVTRISHPSYSLCERIILSCKYNIDSLGHTTSIRKLSRFTKSLAARILHLPLNKHEYKDILDKLTTPLFQEEKVVPVLFPNWDNTPRRNEGALILNNTSPDLFYKHCLDVFSMIKDKTNKTVFIKSWNEWGEGNYMEPCLKYGHGYIDALSKALRVFCPE